MSANLASVDALKRLRLAMLQFIERAENAIGTSTGSLQRSYSWLREQQLPRLEGEMRRAEIRLGEARIAYNSAKMSVRLDQKASFEDEEREFLKAKARYDRCDEAMQRTRYWQRHLEKEGNAHLMPIRQLGRRIEEMREQGIAELDRKIADVSTYLGQDGTDGR